MCFTESMLKRSQDIIFFKMIMDVFADHMFHYFRDHTGVRIFTQNTSNDVVPGKEVPFGGPYDYILYLDP